MKAGDDAVERLLRSAGQVQDEKASAPFGFDTRIVALWRSGNFPTSGNGIVRLVRLVALLAAFVILISGAASFREFSETRDIFEPGADEFAIADSAIQNEFYR